MIALRLLLYGRDLFSCSTRHIMHARNVWFVSVAARRTFSVMRERSPSWSYLIREPGGSVRFCTPRARANGGRGRVELQERRRQVTQLPRYLCYYIDKATRI